MRKTKKQLKQEIERLTWVIKQKNLSIKILNDFIIKNCKPCPDCGEYGEDCHNYQG
jgi:hypothetical protein